MISSAIAIPFAVIVLKTNFDRQKNNSEKKTKKSESVQVQPAELTLKDLLDKHSTGDDSNRKMEIESKGSEKKKNSNVHEAEEVEDDNTHPRTVPSAAICDENSKAENENDCGIVTDEAGATSTNEPRTPGTPGTPGT